jgi:hypothetical protein
MRARPLFKTLVIVAGSVCVVAVLGIGLYLYWVMGPGYYWS